MISLILTLFICMLSIGSSIYTIDYSMESRISTISNESLNLQDSKPINKLDVINDNNYVYYSLSYFCSDNYLSYLYSNSNNGAVIYPHDDNYTTMSSVFAGNSSYYHVNYNSSGAYPIKFGYFDSIGSFVSLNGVYDLRSIEFAKKGVISNNVVSYSLKFQFTQNFYVEYLFGRYNSSGFITVIPITNFNNNFVTCCLAVPNSSTYVLTPGADKVSLFLPFSYFEDNATQEDYQTGYYFGYDDGYENGKTDGYDEGLAQGEINGYQTGYDYAMEVVGGNATALTIFTGIIDIALVPVNVFLGFMNFDILGINVAGFVSGLLTASMIVIVLRFIFGGKKND